MKPTKKKRRIIYFTAVGIIEVFPIYTHAFGFVVKNNNKKYEITPDNFPEIYLFGGDWTHIKPSEVQDLSHNILLFCAEMCN